MAIRIPQEGDKVKAKPGYGMCDGERGVVIRTDPERASQHKCVVRWADGGEQYVESVYLDIIEKKTASYRRFPPEFRKPRSRA